MKIGLFSDIHSNLEALEACFADFRKEKLRKLFFLGDIIGYGPDPNKCIALVHKKADAILLGNHDAAAVGLLSTDFFNTYAQASMDYTTQVLTPENLNRLKMSPLEATYDIFKMVHACPEEPASWGYILDLEDAEENFKFFEQQVCVIGHSHRPIIIKKFRANRCEAVPHDFARIDEDYRYLVNIGSVGQPRDNDPRSSYMIFDTETRIVSIKRVEYDYQKTQMKMKKAKLPQFLVDRIAVGR